MLRLLSKMFLILLLFQSTFADDFNSITVICAINYQEHMNMTTNALSLLRFSFISSNLNLITRDFHTFINNLVVHRCDHLTDLDEYECFARTTDFEYPYVSTLA